MSFLSHICYCAHLDTPNCFTGYLEPQYDCQHLSVLDTQRMNTSGPEMDSSSLMFSHQISTATCKDIYYCEIRIVYLFQIYRKNVSVNPLYIGKSINIVYKDKRC